MISEVYINIVNLTFTYTMEHLDQLGQLSCFSSAGMPDYLKSISNSMICTNCCT